MVILVVWKLLNCGFTLHHQSLITHKNMRFKVHNEILNTYGFWIKTDGIDMSGFNDNPIALWNHIESYSDKEEQVLPIGYWSDIEVIEGEVFMTLNIDPDDEFAVKIGKKIKNKVLRATSIGIQYEAWSEDSTFLKPGQTRPTITKCRLREVSVVDIPSNKAAIALYDQSGKIINLSDNAEANLDKIFSFNKVDKSTQSTNSMELKDVAKILKLRSDASEIEITGEIQKLKDKAHDSEVENGRLTSELNKANADLAQFRDAEIETILTAAVKAGKFQEAGKATFRSLLKADFTNGKKAIEEIAPMVKLSDIANGDGAPGAASGVTHMGKTFSQLSKENPNELIKLKSANYEMFKQLYKSEFNKDYK
jgi:Caudovirus prohead serine protease